MRTHGICVCVCVRAGLAVVEGRGSITWVDIRYSLKASSTLVLSQRGIAAPAHVCAEEFGINELDNLDAGVFVAFGNCGTKQQDQFARHADDTLFCGAFKGSSPR